MLSIFDRAVLRVAAWPVETVESFAAPTLAALVAELRGQEEAAEQRATALADAVHLAVPGVSDRTTRAWLLAVRRAVHGGTDLLPSAEGTSHVDSSLGDAIEAEAQQRELIAATRLELEQAHERAYDADVKQLRDMAATASFRRALAVSQLDVATRWERARLKPISPRARSRRLEATLMRFLLGACGRPTPRGLWAGVVPVSPADNGDEPGLMVRPAAAQHVITVSLEPFRAVLAAWTPSLRRDHRQLLRLESTLHGQGNQWCWEPEDGVDRGWVRVEPEPLLTSVIDFWADGGAKPADPLIATARDSSGDIAATRLAAAVDHLVDIGVLVCAVDLPTIADDSWAALDAVAGQLKGAEHDLWSATVRAVRTELACLNADFEGHEPDALARHLVRAEQEISALLSAVGAPHPPGPLFEVDTRLPFVATWGEQYRAEVAEAVKRVLGFHASDGAAERYRRASVASLPIGEAPAPILPLLADSLAEWSAHRAAVDAAAPRTRSDALLAMGCDPSVEERRWRDELEPHHAAHEHTIGMDGGDSTGAGPFGSMLLVPGTRLWSKWGRPQPHLFTSRFSSLLPGGARHHAETDGIEVVGSDPENLNAAIHPGHGLPFVDPHGSGGLALRDIKVELDRESALPWLRHAGDTRRRRPVYLAPTVMGRHDPCSRVLRTLAMAHGWELVAWGFPAFPAEIERWCHLPRLVLPGETVISAERWTVPAVTVAKIASAPTEVAKYRAWRDEADRLGLPPVGLVRLRLNPGAPEMLFPTDSPLAVRSIFDRLSSDAEPIVITELPGSPDTWPIQDIDGNHHLCELAVTWFAETPAAAAGKEPG